VRRVGERPGRTVERGQRSMVRAGDDAECQGGAVHVRGDQVATDRSVLTGGDAAVARDGSVVHRVDGDYDGGDVRIRDTVIGLERERVAAVVVRVRRVDVRPVRAHGNRPMRRDGDEAEGEGV